MSHFTRVGTQIRDRRLLALALADLGYAVSEGAAVARGYRGQVAACELVVPLSASYDVGFVPEPDGSYGLVADWWGVRQEGGPAEDAFKQALMQRYAYRVVAETLQAQGFALAAEQQAADSTIQLTWRRWA